MFLNLVMLVNFFLFIKEDSIMFNLSIDNDESALNLIRKVYETKDEKAILSTLKSQVHKKQTVEIKFIDAIFGDKYLKSTLIAMVFTSLC